MSDVIIFSQSSLFLFSLQLIIRNNIDLDKRKDNITTKLFCSLDKFISQLDDSEKKIVIFDIDGISKTKQNIIFNKIKDMQNNASILIFCRYEADSLYFHTLSEVTRFVVSKSTPIIEISSIINKFILLAEKDNDEGTRLDPNIKSQPKLSKREKQVLHLASMGMDYQDISEHLNITRRTVSHYMSNIRDKYGYKKNFNLYFRY
ncbi:bacterial regulatory s, luxR family protein [Yersinia rohdei]|uniref:Bacterial regulatory s, luxR family protein n=3 Tax=Yersinia rohdei TaxID=29485 RepID=A0A0U1HY78_YERRO|nr:LuxR C-terminal-related transcriptional regulator [Yersinia rohdei]AJJ09481.1 bacterial regulatory s, luxR family protein [Yersinia rohdei]MDN0096952.1 LuxR C-terminal-related transcriptional regulator [Yersinia rohdei]CNF49329.1 quorum-sensing transcriptional regulator [Yersinia rohdei]CNJ53131.1 quorum-sensing transcriptional regulator [Yersinia rohdei]CQI97813.1 quorum-sensing transcriptional regulator [Yersinia rohdei]